MNPKSHIFGKSMNNLNFVYFHTGYLRQGSIYCGPTFHICHIEQPCDYLRQPHCKDHSLLCSLNNTKVHFHSNWKVLFRWDESAFRSHVTNLSVALQYFLHSRHMNLGPGFISMSPARMMRVSRMVPLEGLKFCRPSELLRLPSFLEYAKKCEILPEVFSVPMLQSWFCRVDPLPKPKA